MQDKTSPTVPVWDFAVRLFHWSLVVAFTIAYLTEDEFEDLHVWSGYIVLGLVLFRIVWGLVGTRYARFTQFIYSPARVIEYIVSLVKGNPKHYTGHNPAGGYMVIALLLTLLGTTLSGLVVYGLEGKGPLANTTLVIIPAAHANGGDQLADDGKESPEEERWEEIHEVLANITLFLVILHILGVIASSIAHRENLVRAMITGRKKRHD